MTENLLQKLEEKMMLLLTEIEDARKELSRLTQENVSLKEEKETSSRKLQDLIALLDSLGSSDSASLAMPVGKPMLMQVEA